MAQNFAGAYNLFAPKAPIASQPMSGNSEMGIGGQPQYSHMADQILGRNGR